MEESEDLLPIRLYNAMSFWENPIHYPAGIAVVPLSQIQSAHFLGSQLHSATLWQQHLGLLLLELMQLWVNTANRFLTTLDVQ